MILHFIDVAINARIGGVDNGKPERRDNDRGKGSLLYKLYYICLTVGCGMW